MKWPRRDRAGEGEVERLVEEVAAMLSGRLAREWASGDVPAWVRVNELAHAGWDALMAVADGTRPMRPSTWDDAVGFLAAELLVASGNAGELVQLQRSALIPLELDMLAGGPVPTSPKELVQLVLDRVARTRSRRNHPSTG